MPADQPRIRAERHHWQTLPIFHALERIQLDLMLTQPDNVSPEADAAMILFVMYSHLFNHYELANYWFDQFHTLTS